MITRKLIATDPHLQLCDINVPVTHQFIHLGCLFSEERDVTASVKALIGKFYGAANAVIGRIGALSRDEEIWRQVMMRQLLPVLSYGSHLWNLKSRKVCKLVDSAWRRVTRKGLGIGYTKSVRGTVEIGLTRL